MTTTDVSRTLYVSDLDGTLLGATARSVGRRWVCSTRPWRLVPCSRTRRLARSAHPPG